MVDGYGREIDYLRISVTDRCNLRCTYCMPEDVPFVPMEQILTYEEITSVCEVASALGIKNFRLTGGEPLVRKGCTEFVGMLRAIQGIEGVYMTTNGILLKDCLPGLRSAGLDGVNISLDTADRKTYQSITGTDGLHEVLSSIDAALESGLKVKLNAVSLGFGDSKSFEHNLEGLLELPRRLPVALRFIELMPVGAGDPKYGIPHDMLYAYLKERFPEMSSDDAPWGCGPAVYYTIPGFVGKVGLISAIHGKFCGSCNRLRLTSQGRLKGCLCYSESADLRRILRETADPVERDLRLRKAISDTVLSKPAGHCFGSPEKMTEQAVMSSIGG